MISVTIATKGRPDKLARCVNSINACCEILILATSLNDISQQTLDDERVTIYYDSTLTPVAAQNFLASKAKYNIMPASDHVEYHPNSITEARKLLYEEFDGYGVVGFNVTNVDANDDAFVLVGREWYDRHGLYCPEYQHFYADTELGDIAKNMVRFAFCEDAIIESYVEHDATHNHKRAEKLAHDEQVYRNRLLHR
jgi:hypothetical protein